MTHASPKEDIISYIKQKDYDALGALVQRELDHKIDLADLEEIALKHDEKALLYAVKAAKKVKKKGLGINPNDFLQEVLYIQTHLAHFPKNTTYYLHKKKTGLQHTIEYDPETKAHFVLLEGKKALIGTGKKKTVTKAIYYNHKNPTIVARAEQSISMHKELEITKKMRGVEGIFHTLGFAEHKKGTKKFTTIYSKLYRPGSLETMFEKRYKLSLYEKVSVALNILKGLEALHAKGIVHRDLGARNYLINIPKQKPGHRNVVACIADLGRATYAKDASYTKVQGNTTYTAPEGIFIHAMKGSDYYKSDVFATGCVFYRLIHGKKGPWQNSDFVKRHDIPSKERFDTMMHLLSTATKARRHTLSEKQHRSKNEEFEYIVLRMLHPYPQKRQSARSARVQMEKLHKKL